MHLTTKQLQIITVVTKGNEDGSFVDLDEVLERVPYKTSKQSLQFSIRALIKKELIQKQDREKRRGRSRVVLGPTEVAYKIMKSD